MSFNSKELLTLQKLVVEDSPNKLIFSEEQPKETENSIDLKIIETAIQSVDISDPIIEQAIECVIREGQASTSLLQRRLRISYARGGKLIDQMEKMGIVGPYQDAKPRDVLITRQQWLELQSIIHKNNNADVHNPLGRVDTKESNINGNNVHRSNNININPTNDDITDEFIEIFKKLDFADKIKTMNFVLELKK